MQRKADLVSAILVFVVVVSVSGTVVEHLDVVAEDTDYETVSVAAVVVVYLDRTDQCLALSQQQMLSLVLLSPHTTAPEGENS